MFKRHLEVLLIVIMAVFAFTIRPASADWDASIGIRYDSDPYDSYYGNRITSEYRRGYQTDDWVERGLSSVTESPIFSDGIRLTAWASLDQNDYDYAIASAIYYFEIPSNARSLRIKIHYDGEGDTDYVNEELAGRIWIRRTTQADDYEEYYPSEGRYESIEKPLYGDTFALPARKRLEIIRTSAREHIDNNGIMELHVVAEGRQRIDIKYIEVETYSHMPNIRVITKYYRDYTWRPWHNYTYWYFYTGPVFHFSDYYYVRYTYPYYHRNYIEIRRYYDNYLRVYYVSRPHYHFIYWDDVVYIRKGEPRRWHRERLGKWTPQLEETRRTYHTTTKTNRTVEIQRSRERVRSVLADTTRRSPSAERARSSIQTRGEAVRDIKQRREVDIRTRTTETRTIERTPARTRTSDDVRSSRDEVKTRPNVQRSTSTTVERERVIRSTPQRSSTSDSSRSAPSNNSNQVKQRREAPKREVKRDDSSKAPKREAKVEENKKNDDDEDEEEKKKRQSSSSSSSDNSSRKRIRNR